MEPTKKITACELWRRLNSGTNELLARQNGHLNGATKITALDWSPVENHLIAFLGAVWPVCNPWQYQTLGELLQWYSSAHQGIMLAGSIPQCSLWPNTAKLSRCMANEIDAESKNA